MGLTRRQFETLRRPLNSSRVAKRQQGGKTLSYLEAWDVRAHLIRVFSYGNFDEEILDCYQVGVREYDSKDGKPMAEAIWYAKVRLTIRDIKGNRLCRYTEAAVGSTSGPASMISEHHDNALKTAASDALKRCTTNLGTQFGLSLYDNGTLLDVVKRPLWGPDSNETPLSPEQTEALRNGLGVELKAVAEESAGMPSQQEVGDHA